MKQAPYADTLVAISSNTQIGTLTKNFKLRNLSQSYLSMTELYPL